MVASSDECCEACNAEVTCAAHVAVLFATAGSWLCNLYNDDGNADYFADDAFEACAGCFFGLSTFAIHTCVSHM